MGLIDTPQLKEKCHAEDHRRRAALRDGGAGRLLRSPEELEAIDNHTGNSWGLHKGADGYAVCRARQQEQHRDDQRRIAGTLAVAAVVAGAAAASSH